MFQNRVERKRQKELKHLGEIADAFCKARGVYPPGYADFLEVAGESQVNLYYMTMHLIEAKADEIGVRFVWWYEAADKEWKYQFTDKRA